MSDGKKVTRRAVVLGTIASGKNGTTKTTSIQAIDDNDQLIGQPGSYSQIKNPFLVPGGVITIDVIEDSDGSFGTIYPGTIEYEGPLSDKELAAKFRLQHQAQESIVTSRKQAEKARRDNSEILELLKPLRQQWRSTNHDGRLALEIRVLNYLRNGSDL